MKRIENIFQIVQNEGTADRIARSLITLLLFAAGAFFFEGTARVFFILTGVIMTVTTALGFCPLYHIFGINTCGHDKK